MARHQARWYALGRRPGFVPLGFPVEWIARSRSRIVLFCFVGACLAACGIWQAHRNTSQSRVLVATGVPTQAVVTGRRGDHVQYAIGGKSQTVLLAGAWDDGPTYTHGQTVTVYVSPEDSLLVATKDGYLTASLDTVAPLLLIAAGFLVVLAAGPGIIRWAARTVYERNTSLSPGPTASQSAD